MRWTDRFTKEFFAVIHYVSQRHLLRSDVFPRGIMSRFLAFLFFRNFLPHKPKAQPAVTPAVQIQGSCFIMWRRSWGEVNGRESTREESDSGDSSSPSRQLRTDSYCPPAGVWTSHRIVHTAASSSPQCPPSSPVHQNASDVRRGS